MKIKDVIAYLQKFHPDENCAFSLWTNDYTDNLLANDFRGIELDYYAREKILDVIQDSDALWDVAKQAVNDLLDGEL